MVYNQKVKNSGVTMALVMDALCFMLIMSVTVAIISMLILRQAIGTEQGIYGVVLALLLGSFVGAFTAVSITAEKALLVSLAGGVVNCVLLIVIKLAFFEGPFSNMLLTILLLLGGSVAAGFVKMRKKGNGYSHRKRRVRIR